MESRNIKKIDFIITVALVVATITNIILGGVVVYGSSYEVKDIKVKQSEQLEDGPDGNSNGLSENDIDVEDTSFNINHDEYRVIDSDKDFTPIGEFKITAFTAGYESTGKTPDHPDYGVTASGNKVKENHTIASDWDVLPPGTIVYIEDVGIRTVEDRGGKVKGNHIDLYIEGLDEALEWGVQYKEVWIIENEGEVQDETL